jgi:hypothetical protein
MKRPKLVRGHRFEIIKFHLTYSNNVCADAGLLLAVAFEGLFGRVRDDLMVRLPTILFGSSGTWCRIPGITKASRPRYNSNRGPLFVCGVTFCPGPGVFTSRSNCPTAAYIQIVAMTVSALSQAAQ